MRDSVAGGSGGQSDRRSALICDTCANYVYDDEMEEWVCDVNMDEDDLARFLQAEHASKTCPYYINGDEYRVVRRQNT